MIPLPNGTGVKGRNAVHPSVENPGIVRVTHARPAGRLAGTVRFDQIVSIFLFHIWLNNPSIPINFIRSILIFIIS